eukprot:Pgem_evm1s15070
MLVPGLVDQAVQQAVNENSTLLRELFNRGIVDCKQESPFGFPLIFAAKLGDLELVKCLLSLKVDTECADNRGWLVFSFTFFASVTNADYY